MAETLFVIFNHTLTEAQAAETRERLGAERIVAPPEDLQALWRQVPAELEGIAGYLVPLRDWLAVEAKAGDFVLIQGDFGATWIMVKHAFELGLVPVYSTTERQAEETVAADGAVQLVHTFRHRRFRRYGA